MFAYVGLPQNLKDLKVPVEVINRSISRPVGVRFFLTFLFHFYSKIGVFKYKRVLQLELWDFYDSKYIQTRVGGKSSWSLKFSVFFKSLISGLKKDGTCRPLSIE